VSDAAPLPQQIPRWQRGEADHPHVNQQDRTMTQSTWQVFQLNELLQRIERGGVRLHEFLRTPSLSCAISHLPAGSNEMATAHEEDELYFVLEGRARLRIDDEDHAVEKGTLLYVEAACDHSFFDIEEDLTVIAFFGGPLPRRRG
jgi:mannose-6-phosphate isomerase-like protein (cupin superfamily)